MPATAKVMMISGRPDSTSPIIAIAAATTVADTTVIGHVGQLTCVGVPPNKAATIPKIIAPYKPAAAPIPDCSQNANAIGNATIPAVKPPKMSHFFTFILYSTKEIKSQPATGCLPYSAYSSMLAEIIAMYTCNTMVRLQDLIFILHYLL